MTEGQITIGNILKPVGLKGELKVNSLSDAPGRFWDLISKSVSLSSRTGESRPCTVISVREDGRYVYLKFKEILSPEDALPYVGGELRIPGSEAAPLPEGFYYHFQLIGCDVYDEENRWMGKVAEVLQTGGNDVLVVQDGKSERLLPALRSVVIDVGLEAHRLTVRPMKEMVDRNAM